MVSDEKIQKAIDYLQKTDEAHAKARAEYNSLSELRKTVLAYSFDECTGGVKEREMGALRHPQYEEHIKKIEVAEIAFHTMHNRRQHAYALIDLYRTICANTRKGNL